jgi:hypothetical protein
MRTFRNLPLALVALAVSAGAVFGFSALPSAADPGLDIAGNAADHTVPARPDSIDLPAVAPTVDAESDDAKVPPDAADLPDSANHGAAVSAVATADDPTPDTNRGADVSAVARDNHGQAEAAANRPDDAGKPDDADKPADPGKPDSAGKPDGAGRP